MGLVITTLLMITCIVVGYTSGRYRSLWLPVILFGSSVTWGTVATIDCRGEELRGLGWFVVFATAFVGVFTTLLTAIAVSTRRAQDRRTAATGRTRDLDAASAGE